MEELLELAEDEENGDGQADALELRTEGTAPAPPPPEMETQTGPQEDETAEEAAPAEAGDLPTAVKTPAEGAKNTALPEQLKELPGGGGPADGAMPETVPEEPVPAQFWRDGPEQLVAGSNGTALLRRPGAGDVELAWTDAPSGGAAEDSPAASPQPEGRGLEKLYRQAVQAARPAPQALSAPQPGQGVRLGELETPRQLTVDELDRAVRRDSRRYDGGLEIF